jgi:hypothetical protein
MRGCSSGNPLWTLIVIGMVIYGMAEHPIIGILILLWIFLS